MNSMQAKTMGALDVNELFANVSLGKTIDILYGYILLNKLPFLFPVKSLKDLLLLLCSNNVKSPLEGEFIWQIDGVIMTIPGWCVYGIRKKSSWRLNSKDVFM